MNFPMTLAGFTKAYDGRASTPRRSRRGRPSLPMRLPGGRRSARQKLIEQQQKESGAN